MQRFRCVRLDSVRGSAGVGFAEPFFKKQWAWDFDAFPLAVLDAALHILYHGAVKHRAADAPLAIRKAEQVIAVLSGRLDGVKPFELEGEGSEGLAVSATREQAEGPMYFSSSSSDLGAKRLFCFCFILVLFI